MRLLTRLEALEEQTYDNNYNHYLQSFFYNLIKDTEFSHLHEFNGTSSPKNAITPFCFSNIFPYGDMKKGDIKNIIISSPNEKFIFLLYDKIKRINSPIRLGGMEFFRINSKIVRLNISYPLAVVSVTPIIVRIPRSSYQDYGLDLKYPYEYIFWRQSYPLELFLSQLEMNLKRKFVNYYGHPTELSITFSKFMFERQISRKLIIRDMVQIIIATYWKFWFDEDNELVRFGLDAGLGERNRLGFGFMNIHTT
jgi:CRISPR-associated endoribonuclease Cas6